jgi:hypothetical protein
MPKVSLRIPHNLGKEEARKRIQDLLADPTRGVGNLISDLEQSWNGDVQTFRFRAWGFHVSGTLTVEPSALVAEMHVPLAALPFRGKIEREIHSHAANLLA